MKEVNAITNISDIEMVTRLFKKHSTKEVSAIWDLGIQVALRISDLLALKWANIDFENGYLTIVESKTGKQAKIKLNEKALFTLSNLNQKQEYIFQATGNLE